LFLNIYIIDILINPSSEELLNIKEFIDNSTAYFNHILEEMIDSMQKIKEYVFVLLLVYNNHINIKRATIDIFVAIKGISSLILVYIINAFKFTSFPLSLLKIG
jgi:hypothetical protein